mmetsp:Transcript_25452/g.39241  ORF Transcript_25452/g.39241 Transcript_25452/m.39241 type:complete len:90 (-) Transcript_25452:17-286(-)
MPHSGSFKIMNKAFETNGLGFLSIGYPLGWLFDLFNSFIFYNINLRGLTITFVKIPVALTISLIVIRRFVEINEVRKQQMKNNKKKVSA